MQKEKQNKFCELTDQVVKNCDVNYQQSNHCQLNIESTTSIVMSKDISVLLFRQYALSLCLVPNNTFAD